MNHQDHRAFLRLLDAMDDHFDRRISDREFLNMAAHTRDSLNPSAAHDPELAAAVRSLEELLSAEKEDALPTEAYDNLRFALAELEVPL